MGRIDTTVNAELWQPTFLAQKLQNIELVRKFFFFFLPILGWSIQFAAYDAIHTECVKFFN